MINDFEKFRRKLHRSIERFGLNSKETKKISERFDKLVNEYYDKERQYKEDNIMKKVYIESIEKLRKITKIFSKFPSINEWNIYAKENNLLCSESIKYISGLNWHQLRNRILSEI